MSMHPRKIASTRFVHELERFNEPKTCPCCHELYTGWGNNPFGYFDAKICDDCFVNHVQYKLALKKAENSFQARFDARMVEIRKLIAEGKMTRDGKMVEK